MRKRGVKADEQARRMPISDVLRSARYTADEKICRMLDRNVGERQEAIGYLRDVLRDHDKDDCSRTDAGKILEALDKREAADSYLEIMKNGGDNIWMRCFAMAFFIRDKSFFEKPEFLEKVIFAFASIANNFGEEPETVIKQAAATISTIYSVPLDKIPKKTRELLSQYRDY